jgi:hypothetical protein
MAAQATKSEAYIALIMGASIVGNAWRQIVCRDEKNHRPAAVRMTDGELRGRPCAGRDGDDECLIDAELFQERDIGISLRRRGGIGG